MTQTHSIPGNVAQMLEPRRRLPLSEWAVEKFVIKEKGAVFPGPYDLSLTPYWRDPMDSLSDPKVRRVNIAASAQTGKTQVMNVFLAFIAAERPCNILYVRPTEPDIGEAFRDRFRPMIEENLPHLIPPMGEWVVTGKNPVVKLNNMLIYGAAATVPRHMTSRTTLVVAYDETDSGGEVSNALGNVLGLLDERQMAGSAARSLTFGASTPKYDDGSNWIAYDEHSDRRVGYEPCPVCGAYQELKMGNIVAMDGEQDPVLILGEDLARLKCQSCKTLIEPTWQSWMADRLVWVTRDREPIEKLDVHNKSMVAEAKTLAKNRYIPPMSGEPSINPHHGYRVWRANTKFEQCGWSNILATFQKQRKTPDTLQVFVNNWLAEPWKTAVASADEDKVRACKGVYEPRQVPTRAKVVLGAIDVQQDCLWYAFRAFGPYQESWLIEYGSIEVHAQQYQQAFETLRERAMLRGWPVAGHDQLHVRCYAMAVDSGYRADEVYEFSRQQGIIAVKGHDEAVYRVRSSQVEGKQNAAPVDLFHLNNKAFMERLQRMIHTPEGESGRWNLHRETEEEYISMLASEHLVKKKGSAKRTWQPKTEGRANHLLDVERYILGLSEAIEQRGEMNVMSLLESDPVVGQYAIGEDPLAPRRVEPEEGSELLGGSDWI